jgi:hypothetical protein
MPCHEVVTAALLRDMREFRGVMIRMQIVYQETSPQDWAGRVTHRQDRR